MTSLIPTKIVNVPNNDSPACRRLLKPQQAQTPKLPQQKTSEHQRNEKENNNKLCKGSKLPRGKPKTYKEVSSGDEDIDDEDKDKDAKRVDICLVSYVITADTEKKLFTCEYCM
ncbi:hypothetical protein ILUMI_06066 [Ignelater luminosus]|uniref:Uncharacterized protein n=1 Tax=Ignelater luminosus TaxID=2038154 RepID=A0A8K0GCY5_IGNLU|nr:hypothetical protein ILUMI_06066 [Ignelater luminosus]